MEVSIKYILDKCINKITMYRLWLIHTVDILVLNKKVYYNIILCALIANNSEI